MANIKKSELLQEEIEHIDITKHDLRPLVEAFSKMSFSARDLARASEIYDKMLADKECGVVLCLAGSLFSAGLKKIVWQMVESNMVDAIVSTGANIVDQDFFEA
ncbi:MAG: deoxyhypusine synthase family protein, partial [Elusimicrobia bacterium]|nr:deoxyhypusine synthase family protein [Elusimicrobiota bacterium]